MYIKVPKIKSTLDLGLFLFTIKAGCDLSAIIPSNIYIDNIIIVLGLSSMIITIIQQGYSTKRLIQYAVIALISLYCTFASGQAVIVITVITIMAIRRIDISKIIRSIRLWSIIFLCIHTVLFFVLLFFNQTQLFVMDAQGRLRASFGFNHSNSFSVFLFNIIIAWAWENYERLNTKHIVFLMIIETVSFFFTDSKTAFACSIIFSILLLIVVNTHKTEKWIHKIAAYCVPAISCFFLFLYNNWKNGNILITLLDTVLTGRIKLGAYAFAKYGLTMFGQKLEYGAVQWNPVWQMNFFTLDCTYTSLWMNIGWIWIVIISVCFLRLAKMHELKISVFIIVWSLYAITEVHGLNCYLCFPILLISLLLIENTERKNMLIEGECRDDR